MSIATLILCAGESKRLGTPKQLLKIKEQTLLAHACHLARTFGQAIESPWKPLVVSGQFHHLDAQEFATSSIDQVTNTSWQDGLPSSIAVGVSHRSDAQGILILLVDQYRVELDDLLNLYQNYCADPSRPVAAKYNSTLGPPVIWPSVTFQTLKDQSISNKHQLIEKNAIRITMPAAEFDVDTPEDLLTMKQYFDQPT